MRKPKPKFKVGQVVITDIDEPVKILRMVFDPCDGWLYSGTLKGLEFIFEENIRLLSRAEIGPGWRRK